MDKFSLSAIVATTGSTISYFLGGWDMLIQLLTVLIIADYLTGIAAAVKAKNLSSNVMYWAGIRKATILVVIMIAFYFDQIVNDGNPVFRNIAIWFYIGREGLSVVENLGNIGMYVPPFLKKILKQIDTKQNNKQ
jgi:toxin secretion/phage lysis holin